MHKTTWCGIFVDLTFLLDVPFCAHPVNTKKESVLARDHIVVPVRQDKIVCSNKRKQTVGEDGWWVIAIGEGACVLYAYDVLYQL